jgi:hypothetical protein
MMPPIAATVVSRTQLPDPPSSKVASSDPVGTDAPEEPPELVAQFPVLFQLVVFPSQNLAATFPPLFHICIPAHKESPMSKGTTLIGLSNTFHACLYVSKWIFRLINSFSVIPSSLAFFSNCRLTTFGNLIVILESLGKSR